MIDENALAYVVLPESFLKCKISCIGVIAENFPDRVVKPIITISRYTALGIENFGNSCISMPRKI